MSNKKSVIIKRDIEENWLKATTYIPNEGIFIVIDRPDGSIGLKLGDGETLVNDLPDLLCNNSNINVKTQDVVDEVLTL